MFCPFVNVSLAAEVKDRTFPQHLLSPAAAVCNIVSFFLSCLPLSPFFSLSPSLPLAKYYLEILICTPPSPKFWDYRPVLFVVALKAGFL